MQKNIVLNTHVCFEQTLINLQLYGIFLPLQSSSLLAKGDNHTDQSSCTRSRGSFCLHKTGTAVQPSATRQVFEAFKRVSNTQAYTDYIYRKSINNWPICHIIHQRNKYLASFEYKTSFSKDMIIYYIAGWLRNKI